ncbi:MAG: 8-amino-7-oxononanoate synthase [Gammaproteobacteria bacterium]|jgi:8-amino-7-oxononanoate synthase
MEQAITAGFVKELEQRKKDGLYRERQLIHSSQGSVINVESEEYINFSSNDYLGFANNKKLKEQMIQAIEKFGLGAGSSQLLVGHSIVHSKLETRLAEFLHREAALVFSTGYQANLAIASALIDENTVVLQDKLNHASLIDSALLSKGKLVRYKHNDVDHLKSLFEKHKNKKLILMTDGVFSMDGDYAPLLEIVDLCKTYNAILIVDDAHGIGVLGETGGGLLEELQLNQTKVPLLIGTFGKSFGASGAFISGSRLLIEMFIQKARTYIYTTALMPAIAATMTYTIDMMIDGDDLRKNIKELISVYKAGLSKNKLDQKTSTSHIQPYIVGDADKALQLSESLKDEKILVSAIRPPTVPKDTSRLRISLTATHSREQVEKLTASLAAAV